MIELVAFLGNHGKEYAHNRHNAAWLLAERWSLLPLLSWQNKFKGRYAALDAVRLPRPTVPGNRASGSVGSASNTVSSGAGTAASSTSSGSSGTASGGTGGGVGGTGSAGADRSAGGSTGPSRLHFLMPLTYMNLSGDSVGEVAAFFKIPAERILVIHDELELPLGTASLKFSGGLGGHNGLRSIKARLGTADFWRFRIGIGRPNHDDISGWVLSDFSKDETPLLGQVLDAGGTALGQILSYGPEFLLPEWNKKKF